MSYLNYHNHTFVARGSPVLLVLCALLSPVVACTTCINLAETCLLVLDGNITTSARLVGAANVVGNLLILGLLDGGL